MPRDSFQRPAVSRRAVLGAATASTGLTLLSLTPNSAAGATAPGRKGTAAQGRVILTPLTTTIHIFDPDFVSAIPFEEVVGVRVVGPPNLLARAILTITFDSRISTCAESGVIVAWGANTIRQSVDSTEAAAVGSLVAVLSGFSDEPSGEIAVIVGLPLHCRSLYPNENLGQPTPTRIGLSSHHGHEILASVTVDSASPVMQGKAWGTAVSAVWHSLRGSGANEAYSYPAFLRVHSVGPAPAPAGTTLYVTADSNIARLGVEAVYRNDVSMDNVPASISARDGVSARTVAVTFTETVTAGDSVTIVTDVHPATRRAGASQVTFARAWIEGPDASSPFQRVTGSESTVAVSGSGRPLIAAAFIGKN